LLRNFLWPPKTGKDEAHASALKVFGRSVKFLDSHFDRLEKNATGSFIAGTSTPTIADLLIVTELDQHLPAAFNLFDYGPYPNVMSWLERCSQTLDSYDEIFQPVVEIATKMKSKQP
jgi:glutathione S-transferase